MRGKLGALVSIAAFAATLSACVTTPDLAFETELLELKGEVLRVNRARGPGPAKTFLELETKNVNYKAQPQPGENMVWHVDIRTSLLEAAGVTQADLVEGRITVVGYRFAEPFCGAGRGCAITGRQIRLENGCVLFVGLSNADYSEGPKAKRWNMPEDGLEKVEPSKCG